MAFAALFAAAVPVVASPDDNIADWLKLRIGFYPGFVAAKPARDADIAALKTQTSALVAAAGPLSQTVLERPPVTWDAPAKPIVFLDDPVGPRVAVIPAGEFTMGSPGDEPGRATDEGPQHRVRIAAPFAVSLFPIVYGEFAQFTAATHYRPHGSCTTFEDGTFAARPGRDWDHPGYPAIPRGAATCVSFNDAAAYTAWLSKKTGFHYRLLSEAESEYVARAGSTTAFGWGTDAAAGCAFANGFDLDAKPFPGSPTPIACHDGNAGVGGVGGGKANAFGLIGIVGNIASWTADCWKPGYAGAPTDGSARRTGDCGQRVLRGGSWASADLRSAKRYHDRMDAVFSTYGFRVVREL